MVRLHLPGSDLKLAIRDITNPDLRISASREGYDIARQGAFRKPMWIGTGLLASTSAKGSQRHNALRRQSSLMSEKMHKFGVESVPSTRGHVVKKYEELHHMPFYAGVAPRTKAGVLHHRNRGWKCGTI